MSVPTNLIPTKITGLPEYMGSSQAGYLPYVLEGSTYKVQFSNIASAGEVPPSRTLTAGTGLTGGGDLSANRVFAIAAGGVGADQLDTTGVVAGVYGDGSNVPTVTVDANGRVTSVTTSPVVASGYAPVTRTITAGTGLLGGGSLASDVTLSLNLASATPQALGTATAGVSTAAAREDHVHPAVDLSDTNETQGALPLGRGGTGDALSPVAGAVVYSTGTKFALTNPGVSGQVLTSTGTDEPIWATLSGTGTVTSVNASGGTTGMTFTGGPITTSGTLTLGGTLAVASGGTGQSSYATGAMLYASGATTLSPLALGSYQRILTAGISAPEWTLPANITVGNASKVTITPSSNNTNFYLAFAFGSGSNFVQIDGGGNATYNPSTNTLTVPNFVGSLTGNASTVTNGVYTTDVGTVTDTMLAGGITNAKLVNSSVTIGTTAISLGGTVGGLVGLSGGIGQTGAGTTQTFRVGSGGIAVGGDSYFANSIGVAQNLIVSGSLTLGSPLAVANGGTGATTASGARTNLGAAASGANSDITSLSGITGGISTPTFIAFNTSGSTPPTLGQLRWNTDDGTLDLGLNGGAILKTGQQTLYYAKNTSGSSIPVGTPVMFTGTVGASGKLTFGLAVADGSVPAEYMMGVAAHTIANNDFGYVTDFGLVRGFDTTGSPYGETWADGDLLYFDPAAPGTWTNVEPVAPNIHMPVAVVLTAASGGSGAIFVRMTLSQRLGELQDVIINGGGPAAGQVLIYDAAQQRWENNTLTAGSNVTITNGNGAITIAASDQFVGTVTSVAASGGTTGLTFSGSPITTSGTLTLGGTLAIGSGGTNGSATPVAGAVAYGTGTAYAFTTAGTAGQVLLSNGLSAPSFGGIDGGTF